MAKILQGKGGPKDYSWFEASSENEKGIWLKSRAVQGLISDNYA